MVRFKYTAFYVSLIALAACSKSAQPIQPAPPVTETFKVVSTSINGTAVTTAQSGVSTSPLIVFSFTAPVDRSTVSKGITLTSSGGSVVTFNASYQNNDSTLLLQPASPLAYITPYVLAAATALQTKQHTPLTAFTPVNIITQVDPSDKFPRISDSALLDKVQQQTFKYFWDFGHPVSGMARERNSSGDLVTTGGTGFGIMAMVAATSRSFITRQQAVERITKITSFLATNCTRYHGAFAHWVNGATGATIPFSTNDNGADLVETAYLMEGLLTARQYFNGAVAAEVQLRNSITQLWQTVEWRWFTRGGQKVLYWHWSPDKNWAMNVQVTGWNEALITYVLAASSDSSIDKAVYDSGWARNGAIVNNTNYFGYTLPLGPAIGGPLFFEHYSFLGINPNGLKDIYADYQLQTLNHTKINYAYCVANPKQYYGYSSNCWGLTASDVPNGYNANAPGNDVGVIAPTAAIASLPYTPVESMAALQFFYYTMGDKLWGDYGFYDAFSLNSAWFANSTLAIDQGPIIVMIENYRSGLLWKLFTSIPEIKKGMKNLGFTAPWL